MKKKRRPFALPAPSDSGRLLVSLAPNLVGMFRFLLESYDNLACFTVLDRHEALLIILFSPHQQAEIQDALQGINETVPLEIRPCPRELLLPAQP
ncbi:MAG: DUF4911 domain-containing protein [Bilophila sp.]